MKVLFSNPPWWPGMENGAWIAGVRAGSRWPFTFRSANRPDRFERFEYLPYPFFMGYATTYTMEKTNATILFRDSIALRESEDSYWKFLEAERPDFIVLESATPSFSADASIIMGIHQILPDCKIIVTGPITTGDGGQGILANLPVHACVRGEYEKGVVRVLGGEKGLIDFDLLTKEEMNAAPIPYWDPIIAHRYIDTNPHGQVFPQAQVWSSRGCPFKCLAGDTPINTINGMVPIRDLVEQGITEIPVFTYLPSEKRAKISLARRIAKYGRDKLVRVHFDDGTHIDTTPDHKFLAFKWGNQFVGEREWEVEAQHLEPGTHLRAIKESLTGPKRSRYIEVGWSRRGRMRKHRMIAEWNESRKLGSKEHVHHDDHDRLNNLSGNLEVKATAKEHFAEHPEIAERMRTNNPAAGGLSEEWKGKIGAANRGKKRSPESIEKYRAAAKKREATKRGEVINHRVVSVEPLPGEHDVYCMEVPESGWFYANNVLVHNCIFCVWPAAMTGNDPDGTQVRTVRHYTAEYMEEYLRAIVDAFGFRSIYFDDDTFNLGNSHTLAMCEVMRKIKLPWSAMCRADTIKDDTWQAMKDSGCFGVKLGFESGNQKVVDEIVNKHLDLEEGAETVRLLKHIGMTVHGTFTGGLPGETPEQLNDTWRFIQRLQQLGMDSYQFSGTASIEGTPLHTLHTRGKLEKFPGAVEDANYKRESDGNRKALTLINELRNS